MRGIGHHPGPGIQIPGEEYVRERDAKGERDGGGELCIGLQHRGGGAQQEILVELHPSARAVGIGERGVELLVKTLDAGIAVAERDRVELVEAADRGEQADGRVDHHRAMNVQLVLDSVDRLDDGRIRSAETVAEHIDIGDAHLAGKCAMISPIAAYRS
jgi:hypothetical protein